MTVLLDRGARAERYDISDGGLGYIEQRIRAAKASEGSLIYRL